MVLSGRISLVLVVSLALAACGGGGASTTSKAPAAPAGDSATRGSTAVPDGTAPTPPSGLVTRLVAPDHVVLEWAAARDNVGVVRYEVFRDGSQLQATPNTQLMVGDLQPLSAYSFQVRAVDAAGNRSSYSSSLSVTTASLPVQGGGGTGGASGGGAAADTQPPSTPLNVVASNITPSQVALSWSQSTDNVAVMAYDIVRQQAVVATVAAPPAQISGLAPGTQYSFQVRARDAAGNLSALSAALAVTTQSDVPPVAVTGQQIYTQSCVVCHGADGNGTALVPPVPVTRAMTLDELTLAVEQRMPPADPASCVGECATKVAQYVFDTFTDKTAPAAVSDPLAGLPEGAAQTANVCGRAAAANRSDVIRDAFCGATPAQITSLQQLQAALGLVFNSPNATGRRNNAANGNPGFALTGHSSSLVARSVNALNPRAIIFTPAPNRVVRAGYVAMGFVRGDQFVEVAAADRNNNNALNFYLVRFKQACNVSESCSMGDLLTPAVESNWLDVTVYDEVDLRNTVVDCLQCHQVNGPGTQKILRMQELANPWTHWFRDNNAGNLLLADFQAAHGTAEAYAGIPANLISASDPARLEDLVRGAGFRQPNEFPSATIENEVRQTAGQPADNSVPGVSPAWDRIYANTVTAQAIAVPYHDVKVTDPTRVPAAIQAYQGLRNGTVAPAALPDLRDLFYEAQLRDIGFKVQAGLDGRGIITQACGQCHNSRLDQTIGRARFNIDLAAMSDTQGGVLAGTARDAEIGVAISRLQMPAEDVRKMPPELFRTLEPGEIDLAVGYLCSQTSAPIAQCAGR